MLAHRLRHWPSIDIALDQLIVFSGMFTIICDVYHPGHALSTGCHSYSGSKVTLFSLYLVSISLFIRHIKYM